jgi:hypothetical protein
MFSMTDREANLSPTRHPSDGWDLSSRLQIISQIPPLRLAVWIKFTFHARCHAFSAFSRAIASSIVG